MDDTLKRLLAAEQRASEITQQAEQQSAHTIQAVSAEVRVREERFSASVPDLRQSFLDKAEQKAAQTIAESSRRHLETIGDLRLAAESNENQALDAAFELILGGPEMR